MLRATGMGLVALSAVCACSAAGGAPPNDSPVPETDAALPPQSTPEAGADAMPTNDGGGGGGGPKFEVEVITTRHRFIPNAMFGGWGPHLGHLVRAPDANGGTALYFVDDVCSQSGGSPPVCDVLHDNAVGVFRLDGGTWTNLGETPLPGQVQQNTGTMAMAGVLRTYGIDIANEVVQECSYDTKTATRACEALPFSLDASSNYIGAAVSPTGTQMVWWTVVKDGGGGSFQWIANYGGGWNGPRTGDVGGYNDSSYINIAFRKDTTAFTMHTQLVSGLAPNWAFLGATGEGDAASTNAVTWANSLAPPAGDSVMSTNDIFIDPTTSDTHLLARTTQGAAVYYFRPKNGSWSGPLTVISGVLRARFSASGNGLAMVFGPTGAGLKYKLAPAASIVAGKPIDWTTVAEHSVPLPAGYDNIDAIYTESSVYQTTPTQDIHVAVVGATRQNEALHVGIVSR
jgi:hypothetical protein